MVRGAFAVQQPKYSHHEGQDNREHHKENRCDIKGIIWVTQKAPDIGGGGVKAEGPANE